MSEVKIAENLLRKLGRQMGIRNRVKLDEVVTDQTISDDDVERPDDYDPRMDQVLIPVHGSDELSPQEREVIADTTLFCQRTSLAYQDAFNRLMIEYQDQQGRISERMITRIRELELDVPLFELYTGEARAELLAKHDLSWRWAFRDNSVVVVFDLPRVLSQYWWKESTIYKEEEILELNKMAIEWGNFYPKLMPVIWDAVGYQECESDYFFMRINPVGEHQPLQYYYIWEVFSTSTQ